MPSLLAIETTTDTCAVAVYSNQHVVIEHSIRRPRVHAEQLLPMAQEALTYAELRVRDLDGVAVSGGPGSYTGLRIGISTAKGLAFSHDLALIAVPSMDAMAHACSPFVPIGAPVMIARNARKDELYIALYKKTGAASFESLHAPRAVLHEALLTELTELVPHQETLAVAGEGANAVDTIMASQDDLHIQAIPAYSVAPTARAIALLGAILLREATI